MAIIYDPDSAPTDPDIDLTPKPWPPVVEFAILQDLGTRDNQEDCADCGTANAGDGEWALVDDGMGGCPAGEVAAEMARKSLRAWCESHFPAEDTQGAEVHKLILTQVRATNEEIHQAGQADKNLKGMGCAFVLYLRVRYTGYLASAGDCRAYLFNGEYLQRLTEDLVDLLDNNVLSSFLGGLTGCYQKSVSIYDKMKDYAFVLLTSDGLLKVLSEDEIFDILLPGGTAKEACQRLMDAIMAKGKAKLDNITILIIKYTLPASTAPAAP